MNHKPLFCLLVFLILTGCAAQKEPGTAREPGQLITPDNYKDLHVKPKEEKPVYVDYEKEGTYRQSIQTLRKTNPKEANQLRFINNASLAGVDELKLHYENGAKVNFRNAKGETVLIKVLDGPYDNETLLKLKYLLSVGAKLNYRGKSENSDYTTPLGVAIWNSSLVFKSGDATKYPSTREILKLLIADGADISAIETNGRTPLHIAAATNNLYAAKLLLDSGAKVMVEDADGKTPLDLAASVEMVELLKEYGARETQ